MAVAPKIPGKWGKDRGKEPTRPRGDYPWFWSWDGQTLDFAGSPAFAGNRWNGLHYSRAFKEAAHGAVECLGRGPSARWRRVGTIR